MSLFLKLNQIKQDLPKFNKLQIGDFRIGQDGLKAKLPQKHQEYLDKKLLCSGLPPQYLHLCSSFCFASFLPDASLNIVILSPSKK